MKGKDAHTYLGPVERLWPRRLLDTISMTSFEREDGNIYADEKEPDYSILSYTWGRFALDPTPPDAARLPVSGIQWPIPAINPIYFTHDQFQRVVNTIREISGNRFLWLDVACVDQRDGKTKMEEVGRQAGIFANAGMAFVWLWTASTNDLHHTLEDVFESRQVAVPIEPKSMSDFEVGTWLKTLQQAVDTLLDDWWFSSLWTLQEMGLRSDAVIISCDADPIRMKTPLPNTTDFHSIASTDRLYLLQYILGQSTYENSQHKETSEKIRRRILEAGYITKMAYTSNPNTMYTLAYQRKASRELDRIYGIMALYNIQVGSAVIGADTERKYTLEELEDEFVLALNVKSTFLGQSFMHIEKPKLEKSWKITQNARVPDFCRFPRNTTLALDDCLVEAQPGSDGAARITGSITSFNALVKFWEARIRRLSEDDCAADQLLVAVDDYVCGDNLLVPYFDYEEGEPNRTTFERTEKIVCGLLNTFESRRLSVIRLGGFEWNAWSMPHMFGLLILHDDEDWTRCRRMGLCRWEGDVFDISVEAEVLRPSFEERYTGVIY